MFASVKLLYSALLIIGLTLAPVIAAGDIAESENAPVKTDLATSATSAQLFNLGSLFGQNPNYGYGYGNGYGNGYYPSNGYRPNTYYPYKYNYYGGNSYYPSTGSYGGYNGYGGYSGYPANQGWTGSNYPNYGYNTAGGYYPSYGTGGGYYPSGTGAGTNILGGNGGYGGYGGNGGLREYDGYWNTQYSGQRNRGYGYYADTDRYGLPSDERRWSDRRNSGVAGGDIGGGGVGQRERDRDRDHVYGAYRGYD